MLSVVLLIHLSLCNAQWPLQSIGYEDVRPVSRPPGQPGYPYDETLHLTEMKYNPNLKLPEDIDERNKDLLKDTKFRDNLAPSNVATHIENADRNTKNLLKAIKFSRTSGSPEIVNLALIKNGTVKDQVTNLVNDDLALRNETDILMENINILYLNLATSESDNEMRIENVYKYGMSVILRFLLEFYRIFRKLSHQSTQLQISKENLYGLSYDRAVDVIKEKKHYTPLQISASVRRSADIFKSIIYESVILVQTQCSVLDPNWKCVILYLANLISESVNCSNVWYHALIHLLALETNVQNSFVYKIADFDKFKDISYFDNMFDFIIEKLEEYREVGKVQLSAEAVLFTMLVDLQDIGLLNCISIDNLHN